MIYLILDVPNKVVLGRIEVVGTTLSTLDGGDELGKEIGKAINLKGVIGYTYKGGKKSVVNLEAASIEEKAEIFLTRPLLLGRRRVVIGVKEWH